MPIRKIPLVTGEFYHVFSRGISNELMFSKHSDNKRALEILQFYRLRQRKVSFSHYRKLDKHNRIIADQKHADHSSAIVEIIAFCLMPSHFHFVLRQSHPNGISRFIGNFKNSYTQYFNTRHGRRGPLFEGRFKSVHIKTYGQLLHVSRYVHLNPHTSSIINSYDALLHYPWSSLLLYRKTNIDTYLCRRYVLNYFRNASEYITFVLKYAEEQKNRAAIKQILRKS